MVTASLSQVCKTKQAKWDTYQVHLHIFVAYLSMMRVLSKIKIFLNMQLFNEPNENKIAVLTWSRKLLLSIARRFQYFGIIFTTYGLMS